MPAGRVTAERSRVDLADTSDRGVSLSLPRNNSLISGQPRSLRPVEAPRAAVPVPPAGSAGGALQLHAEAEGAAGKVCQGGCSQ